MAQPRLEEKLQGHSEALPLIVPVSTRNQGQTTRKAIPLYPAHQRRDWENPEATLLRLFESLRNQAAFDPATEKEF